MTLEVRYDRKATAVGRLNVAEVIMLHTVVADLLEDLSHMHIFTSNDWSFHGWKRS